MRKENTDRHIRLILRHLKKFQNKDGSWAENNFINALIGYSLSEMGALADMLDSTADYILSQRSPQWSWNYGPRNKHGKYPDDLDDTFCSLTALLKIRPETITKKVLARNAGLLAHSAAKKGGPYFTWANGTWNDVDPVVNANVSFFYSLFGDDTVQTTKYIDESIERQNIQSKYYDNPFLAHYFISRNYRGLKRNVLIRKIVDSVHEAETRPAGISLTELSLAASSLSRLHAPFHVVDSLVKKIAALLDSKRARDEKVPLYIEKISGGTKYHATSAAYALAICGEAISLHQKEARLLEKIVIAAKRRCESLPDPLRREALRMVKKISAANSFKDILLMPYRVAFSSEYPAACMDTAVACGLISFYGWLAYAIYDRIIDGKEKPRFLPLANVFHREMVETCGQFAGLKNRKMCRKILDTLDCAEMLENRHRMAPGQPNAIPSKKQITDKSIGLILPSVLTLIHCGMSHDTPEMKRFIRIFRNYIFVRQMSDDIRDWKEDLSIGISTRVSGRIKNGPIISAREIIACHENAKKSAEKTGATPRESLLLGLIEEYALTARTFLRQNTQ